MNGLIQSCNKLASSTNCFDFSFCFLAKEFGSDDNRLGGKETLTQDLEIASLGDIDDWDFTLIFGVMGQGISWDKTPQFVQIDSGEMQFVSLHAELPDTNFTEVAGVISVHGCPHVSETTCITSTSWMFSMSANTASTAAHWTSQLPDFSQSGCHWMVIMILKIIND